MVLGTDLEEATQSRNDLPTAGDVYDTDEPIPLTEMFDEIFIGGQTEFDSFDELVTASPSDADSADTLEKVGHGEWDEFVAETTEFADGEEFVMAARDYWVVKRLEIA